MQAHSQEEIDADVRHNEAARREMFRIDGARPLGENLEQANALIKAAFELARAFARADR
ncbi:MAG: hypothetical protein ABR946_10215 [Solirubrobacteraceae bacterium]